MKIYVTPYAPYEINGSDFMPTPGTALRRILFSPDNIHSVSIVALRGDGAILLNNEANIDFEFSISRNRRVLAVMRYKRNTGNLLINNNWLVTQEDVRNRAISENPNLVFSKCLNIEIGGNSLTRVDFKINESPVACGVFTDRDLLFVRMNGHHVYPRITEHILQETHRLYKNEAQLIEFLEQNPGFLRRIGRLFFQKLMAATSWLSNDN